MARVKSLIYAIRAGHKPDVYDQGYGDGQEQDQVRDFPRPVYGLFDDQRDASWFVHHKPTHCEDWCCNQQVEHFVNHASGKAELNEEQNERVKLILSGCNVFFTGSAGSGKSTATNTAFKRLVAAGKRVGKTAPTALAALNIGGQTYFRLAGWSGNSKKRSLRELESDARSQKRQQAVEDTQRGRRHNHRRNQHGRCSSAGSPRSMLSSYPPARKMRLCREGSLIQLQCATYLRGPWIW